MLPSPPIVAYTVHSLALRPSRRKFGHRARVQRSFSSREIVVPLDTPPMLHFLLRGFRASGIRRRGSLNSRALLVSRTYFSVLVAAVLSSLTFSVLQVCENTLAIPRHAVATTSHEAYRERRFRDGGLSSGACYILEIGSPSPSPLVLPPLHAMFFFVLLFGATNTTYIYALVHRTLEVLCILVMFHSSQF